jgi:hypothetical protein
VKPYKACEISTPEGLLELSVGAQRGRGWAGRSEQPKMYWRLNGSQCSREQARFALLALAKANRFASEAHD